MQGTAFPSPVTRKYGVTPVGPQLSVRTLNSAAWMQQAALSTVRSG